jgi:tetratricopeptide (TPR) repeat protein
MRTAVAVALLWAFAGIARADRAGDARQHYQSATAHFAVGEFSEAAADYQAAYKLKPDPALLFDAAQAYRLANDLDKALILYKNYLQMYPTQANVEEVRGQIAKLKEAIAANERAKTSPPAGTNEPKQLPTQSAATAAATTSPNQDARTTAAAAAARPAPKRETPIYKKWWLWTVVGVVVAGGAVTAAVLSTRSSGSWSNAPDVGPGSRNGLVQW